MSSWIPFFKAKDKKSGNVLENFEKELKDISKEIISLRSQLSTASFSKSRAKRRVILISSAFYLTFLLYLLWAQSVSIIEGLVVVVVPFAIFFIKNLINFFFDRRINSMNAKVEALKENHHTKIEELKNATNFMKTQDLLMKFGDSDKAALHSKQQEEYFRKLEAQAAAPPAQAPQPAPAESRGRGGTIFDKLLTVIIGDDEFAARNRYALICSNCHTHNGLAEPGVLASKVKYICPQCGTVNNDTTTEPLEESKREDGKSVSQNPEGDAIEENENEILVAEKGSTGVSAKRHSPKSRRRPRKASSD